MLRAGNIASDRNACKPAPHAVDCPVRISVVRRNILSRDIRNELLIAMPLDIHDQKTLQFRTTATETGFAQRKAQLKRHVEPRQAVSCVEFGTADVVNAQVAVANESADLVEAHLGAVGHLKRASRDEPASMDCKDDRLEQRPVFRVKRTIDKNACRYFTARQKP